MKEGKPSFTAEIDAVIRAVETDKPESERLCYDPFAKSVIGKTNKIIGMFPPLRKLDPLPGNVVYVPQKLKIKKEEGTIETFLTERGFYQIKNISGDYYEAEYFKGPNRNRKGCCLCRVVYAMVKPKK